MLKKSKKLFQVASPYFSNQDKKWILKRTNEVLDKKLSTGPFSKKFEEKFAKFIGVKYAVFLNTCTSALEISVRYLNLKKNDEVIVPCETFIATGMAVSSQGGKVVFANINPKTFCIDLDEIKKRTTKKTKALMLVHFGGYMPHDILEIKKYCKRKKISIVEDCAHAIGSEVRGLKAGSIGTSGCFSFFSTKTITTGEGGMLTTNDKKLYNFALSLRERGRDWKKNGELYSIGWRSCRVPEICAVMGLSQFSHIKKINLHRKKICKIYEKEINKTNFLTCLPLINNSNMSIWKHITVINDNKLKREKLAKVIRDKHGIIINWAYDPPLHLQPVYKKLIPNTKKKFKNTEILMKKHFHLPLHMQISEKNAKFIITKVIEECKTILKR